MGNHRHGSEKFDRFVDFHLQHFANVFSAPGHGLSFRIETCALAGFTQHFHIGQKAHADGANALAFTARAAPFAGVEAETVGRVAARFGL